MNYSMDNKIWRVGGPLLVYLGINFVVQMIFTAVIFYVQFNQWDINAAFNGIMYAQQLNNTERIYSLAASGVSALVALPVFIKLMKNDYEYPVNRRRRERVFDLKAHASRFDKKMLLILSVTGMLATLGLSRLMLMLPFDGILGSYSKVKMGYEAGPVWIQLVVLGILVPFMEEVLFRGLIYKRLKVYYDGVISAYISAIIFGVAHFNLIQGLYAFVMGIIFAFVYERCRSLYGTVILHVAANLTGVLTSIIPISIWIDEHVWVKLPVALVYTVLFFKIVYEIYKRTDIDDSDNDVHKGDVHKDNEEIHKIDFSI